jgi:flagellin
VLWVDANSTVGQDSITITINTLTTDANGIGVSTDTLTSQAAAQNTITSMDEAINSVNSMRASIGAFVNRLEHAVNNLMISESNQQAAESSIRDADFAAETTIFTKNQILTQSATAMLAQSNMLPSSVLSLLG